MRRHPRLHRSPLFGSGIRRNRPRGFRRRLKRGAIRLQRHLPREPLMVVFQTAMYGAAVRCKRVSSICRLAVLHQCIRPLIGACCAPGHHGNQRAYVLIKLQTSNGSLRSPDFACAVKTDPPSRLILSQTSAGIGIACYVIAVPSRYRSFVRANGPFLRPGLRLATRHRAQGLSRLAALRPPAGRGLDGSEHGSTLRPVGTSLRTS